LLAPVTSIVRRAAKAIIDIYGDDDIAKTLKTDASPLTEADLRSHRILETELGALTPGVPVLSEESTAVDYAERRGWRCFWLIDPLDGTKEFLARNDEFTVNVALIVDHEPALGVVGVPAKGIVYTGVSGAGAARIEGDGAPTAIMTRRPPPSLLRVVGSRSHRGTSLDALLERLGPHELVAVGSALKFCIVAEGAADFYPRLSPTSEWDTAAAHAVLAAAGGAVTTLAGEPLRYNTKAELLNPSFLAYGDPSCDWRAVLPA